MATNTTLANLVFKVNYLFLFFVVYMYVCMYSRCQDHLLCEFNFNENVLVITIQKELISDYYCMFLKVGGWLKLNASHSVPSNPYLMLIFCEEKAGPGSV